MKSIVYKQSYKPLNIKNTTRVLNLKHLEYICTRPGTIFNKDCGFGLFGKLPYMNETTNLNSLKHAKQIISEVSTRRTIYRGILSLDHETSMEKGYYSRNKWQELVANNVEVIANEMNIERSHFCYMAAMHYKKGHPHVHLLYWDNSNRVRKENMSKDAFKIMAEKIRAGFGKEIWNKEIAETLGVKADKLEMARKEALGLVRELNSEEILDVSRIKSETLKNINYEFSMVLNGLLGDNSRRYSYLKPETKKVVDRFIDKLFTLPQYTKIKRDYLKATVTLSNYFGNSESTIAFNKEKALGTFYKDVGNELLKFVKSENLMDEHMVNVNPQKQKVVESISAFIKENKLTNENYQKLLQVFPKQRTPLSEIIDDEYNDNMHKLTVAVLKNDVMSTQMRKYVKGQARVEMPKEQIRDKEKMRGKEKEMYGEIYGATRTAILSNLYLDNGYTEQKKMAEVQFLLMMIFSETGRSKNYAHSKANSQIKSSSLSKAAKRDLRAIAKNAQGEMEI